VKRPDDSRNPLLTQFSRRDTLALLAAATAAVTAAAFWPGRAPAAPTPAANPMLLDTPKAPVQALDFMGISAAGKPVRLSDLKGNLVLMNFWATWCVPCLEEMPSMDRLNRQMQGKKFKVLAIDLQETADQVQAFAKNNKFSYDLVLDPAGEISHHYGVLRIPVSYLVDPKGFIIRRALGARVWDSKEAVGVITQLLSTPTADASTPDPALNFARRKR